MTPTPDMHPKALILGVTGAFGREVARKLVARGWRLVALVRDPVAARGALAKAGLEAEFVTGDALDPQAVARAAAGARIIVHGVNPPGYRRWREDGLPMLAATIDAARRSGARIVFPGNVYVFSPASGVIVDEATPHTPQTRKGAVRRDMEAMLAAAAGQGVRSLIVRAGDFYGPGVASSWFSGAVAPKGAASRRLYDLGASGVGHAWAYLPDLAEAVARLIDIEATLAPHETANFGGHWLDPGRDMAATTAALLLPRRVPISRFNWSLARLGSVVSPFLREAMEMRWLWDTPLRLDNRKLERLVGPEPHTSLAAALAATLGLPADHPLPNLEPKENVQ